MGVFQSGDQPVEENKKFFNASPLVSNIEKLAI